MTSYVIRYSLPNGVKVNEHSCAMDLVNVVVYNLFILAWLNKIDLWMIY
jgi:hypothetical protein